MAKKDPDVRMWQNRLQWAKDNLAQTAKLRNWDRYMEEYRLIWRILEGRLPHAVNPINLVYGFVKAEVPSLYFRDPWISVNPRKKTDEAIARALISEVALNFKWRSKNWKQELKRAIVDALIIGHAWIKEGYQAETMTVEGQDKKGEKNKKTPSLEVDERIVNEDVFAYKLRWDDVLFNNNDSLYPPQDCRWMAFRFIRPTEALKASSRYINTQDIRPSFSLGKSQSLNDPFRNLSRRDASPAMSGDLGPGDIGMSVGWEIWDKDSKQKFSLLENHGQFVQMPARWPYPFSEFPVSMLAFTEDPESPYPISSIAPWEAHVLEKIKIRSMEINHIKRWNRQVVIRKGTLSSNEKDKFKENIDGSVIESKSNNLGADFYVPNYPAFQSDAYIVEDRIDSDIRNVSGQPETRRGAQTPLRSRTYRELEALNQFAQIRVSEREDIVEDFCEDIAAKVLSLMREFFDMEHMAVISEDLKPETIQSIQSWFTKDGKPQNFKGNSIVFTKEDIQGDFDVEIRKGSTLPLNRETKRQILTSLIQSASQYLPPIVVESMVKELVRELGMKTVEKAIEDAEQQRRIQEIVGGALRREREDVRQGALNARNVGLAVGEGGTEMPR